MKFCLHKHEHNNYVYINNKINYRYIALFNSPIDTGTKESLNLHSKQKTNVYYSTQVVYIAIYGVCAEWYCLLNILLIFSSCMLSQVVGLFTQSEYDGKKRQ